MFSVGEQGTSNPAEKTRAEPKEIGCTYMTDQHIRDTGMSFFCSLVSASKTHSPCFT